VLEPLRPVPAAHQVPGIYRRRRWALPAGHQVRKHPCRSKRPLSTYYLGSASQPRDSACRSATRTSPMLQRQVDVNGTGTTP